MTLGLTNTEWGRMIAQAFAIVIVGFASTVLVVMEGLRGVGASNAQQASAVAALCLAMAAVSFILVWRSKQPILAAWSTPGAVLLATAAAGISFSQAVGAFMLAGALTVVTALFKPLSEAINKVPASIASAMMAGVLMRYVVGVPDAALAMPLIVLPLILLYFALRLSAPVYSVPVVMGCALLFAGLTKSFSNVAAPNFAPLVFVWPAFDAQVLIGIGLPLFLVTMASQNLPGVAVLRAYGYVPDVKATLLATGGSSMVASFFGAHAVNLAVITAAMGAGPDAHPDAQQRWKIAVPYVVLYVIVGLAAAPLVAVLGALPPKLITAVAGLALFAPLLSGASAMLKDENETEAALLTFVVTASGVTFLGVGAAFWGLVCGLALWLSKRMWAQP